MITITLPEWVAWVFTAWVAFKISDMALGLWIRTLNRQLMQKNFAKVDWLHTWAKKHDKEPSGPATSHDHDS